MKKLFIGNLPFNTTDEDLRQLFESIGEVASAHVVMDRQTDRSKGFGFVEMEDNLAEEAISELNDTEYGGRNIRVSEAQERERREPRGDRRDRPYGGRR